jgi:hypothetical protein
MLRRPNQGAAIRSSLRQTLGLWPPALTTHRPPRPGLLVRSHSLPPSRRRAVRPHECHRSAPVASIGRVGTRRPPGPTRACERAAGTAGATSRHQALSLRAVTLRVPLGHKPEPALGSCSPAPRRAAPAVVHSRLCSHFSSSSADKSPAGRLAPSPGRAAAGRRRRRPPRRCPPARVRGRCPRGQLAGRVRPRSGSVRPWPSHSPTHGTEDLALGQWSARPR